MPVDLSYLTEESGTTPDSNPWGQGGVPDGPVATYGREQTTEDSFYDQRDDMVGGTDTQWNSMPNEPRQCGANWASLGDSVPVVNSGSGLGGTPAFTVRPDGNDGATKFSGTLSQDSLAGGSNPNSPYGVPA
jgi:hypothetical protein